MKKLIAILLFALCSFTAFSAENTPYVRLLSEKEEVIANKTNNLKFCQSYDMEIMIDINGKISKFHVYEKHETDDKVYVFGKSTDGDIKYIQISQKSITLVTKDKATVVADEKSAKKLLCDVKECVINNSNIIL